MKFQLFVGNQIYRILSEKQIAHITDFVKQSSVYKITDLTDYIPNRESDLKVFVLFDEYCLDFQSDTDKYGRPVVVGVLHDATVLYDTEMSTHALGDFTTMEEMITKGIDSKRFVKMTTTMLWNFSRDKNEKYKGWGKKWLDILNIKFRINLTLVPFNEKLFEYYRSIGFSNMTNCLYHDNSKLHNRFVQVLVRVAQ